MQQDIPLHNDINELFKLEGLPEPYIPQDLNKLLIPVDDTTFTSRTMPDHIYETEAFISEILSKSTANYLSVGFSGYGTSSNFMHYYLKFGHLALFLQLSWGNIVTEKDFQKNRIKSYLNAIPLLLNNLHDAQEAGLIKKSRQLLILDSDRIGSGWAWVKNDQLKINPENWHTQHPVLLNALYSIPHL